MSLSKNSILNLKLTIVFVATVALYFQFTALSVMSDSAFAQENSPTNNTDGSGSSNQPNINAENIFNTKTMTVGNNVKNLVILIPNEGHHDEGEDNEARFIDQHFVPENAIINTGTTVAWFNGDVGHERTVQVSDTDGNSVMFTTGPITDMELSPTLSFNNTGVYNYVAEGDEGVVMEGKITVVDDISTSVADDANATSTSTGTAVNTVGVLMVPTQDIETYVAEIENSGLAIDSMHDFNDLRGGQKGTGDVQTLIVWTSDQTDLNSVISPISELSTGLPYS